MIDNPVARASLIIMKLDPSAENGGVPRVYHFASPEAPDPMAACWELWESLQSQFPGYQMVIMANQAAQTAWMLSRASERNRQALNRLRYS